MTSHRRHNADRALSPAVDSWLARALLFAALIVGAPQPSHAQDAPDEAVLGQGKSDFQWHCTTCHGPDGKGDGPMAKMLIKRPADLTSIAKRNDGKFPFWQVYRIIAGNEEVPGHETFQMPNFWRRFNKDEKDWGFLPPQLRVLVLTHYVESLQKK